MNTMLSRRSLISGGAAMLAMSSTLRAAPNGEPDWNWRGVSPGLLDAQMKASASLMPKLRAGHMPSSAELGAYVGVYTATMAHLEDVGFHAYMRRNMGQFIRDSKNLERGPNSPVARALAKYGLTLPVEPVFSHKVAPWATMYRQVGMGLTSLANTGRSPIIGAGLQGGSKPVQARGPLVRGGAKIIRVQEDSATQDCYDMDGNVVSCDAAMWGWPGWEKLANNIMAGGAILVAVGVVCGLTIVCAGAAAMTVAVGSVVAGVGGVIYLCQ